MALLNYTTTVPAEKTVAQIMQMLGKSGARQVMSEYDDDGRPTAVAFAIVTPVGLRTFRLPTRVLAVETVLRRQKVPKRYQTHEQAERVAWRIVKDWLEAQLAIVETEMVSLDQVMLPYMHTAGHGSPTVYELFTQQGELGPGAPHEGIS